MGPLSATIVVGWDGVRKAWEMRFGQFDRVTISLPEGHVHVNGNVASAVGVERGQLLRKNGETSASMPLPRMYLRSTVIVGSSCPTKRPRYSESQHNCRMSLNR